MNDQLKNYRKTIRDQRAVIQQLQRTVAELETDRNKFRAHFAERYTWWWKLLNEKQVPNMLWLAEQDSRVLRTFKWWPLS